MSRYSAKTASNTATHAVVRSWAALSASSFMSAARNWSRQMPPSPPLPTDNSSAQSSSPKRDHQQLPKLPRPEREQQQQKQDDRQHNLFRNSGRHGSDSTGYHHVTSKPRPSSLPRNSTANLHRRTTLVRSVAAIKRESGRGGLIRIQSALYKG